MPQNRSCLKKLGKVFYICVSQESVIRTMKQGKKHDWIDDDSFEERVISIFKEREPAYRETADYIIDADGKSAAEIAQMIISSLQG